MDRESTIRNLKLYLFDMDGTIYLGNRLYDFTKDLLAEIRRSGAQYLFLTNNSSKSVNAYVEKLARLGIEATPEDFLTSSQAMAYYLKQHHPDAELYVCGTRSLIDELERAGFRVSQNRETAQCIVMGFDTELTFQKLEDVCRMLLGREIPYLATNPDYVCPTEFGSVPDCGSVCDMIFNATKKRPIVIGKPQPLMPQLAMEMMHVLPSETVVVGDRIYTDIKSGLNAGTVTILVMSGETTPEILAASADKPDIVMESGAEILQILQGRNRT